MGGDNQGSVITRNRTESLPLYKTSEQDWFLVQTNHDMWEDSPAGDSRRDVAVSAMEKFGRRNMTPENLRKVLSLSPVCNKESVFTSIMIPSTGYFKTHIIQSKRHRFSTYLGCLLYTSPSPRDS